MKSLLLTLIVLIGLGASPALAQDSGDKKDPKPAAKPVKTLVDYKDELGLTDEQINGVAEALKNFQETIKTQKSLMVTYEQDYRKLLKDHAPLPEIKQKLRQIADVRFNLRYADVVTSRKVEGLMTAEQLKKWRAIQAKVRSGKS